MLLASAVGKNIPRGKTLFLGTLFNIIKSLFLQTSIAYQGNLNSKPSVPGKSLYSKAEPTNILNIIMIVTQKSDKPCDSK
jgi:hypothetical protein